MSYSIRGIWHHKGFAKVDLISWPPLVQVNCKIDQVGWHFRPSALIVIKKNIEESPVKKAFESNLNICFEVYLSSVGCHLGHKTPTKPIHSMKIQIYGKLKFA